MVMPDVSVIMPFKDSYEFLGEALASINQQKGFNIEVIIVDDNSQKPLSLPLDIYGFDLRIIRNNNPACGGAGFARGVAISNAKGRYIAFLDSDDLWTPYKLSTQIDTMEKENWAFSFGGYGHIDSLLHKSVAYMPTGPFTLKGLLSKSFSVGCLTVVYDRKLISDPIPSDLRRRNDYHLWAQLIAVMEDENIKWGSVSVCLGFYRIRKNSLSSSKIKSIFGYWVFLGRVETSLFLRLRYFFQYFFRVFLRRFKMGN